jgi:uncharacterized protein YbjT (DUF2867 family)
MYVVVGASGNTGRVVAETLLADKQKVRAVVRTKEEAEAWKGKATEVALADLDDVAALTAALRGGTSAYLLLPPQYASTDVRSDNARRTTGYVKAVQASGLPHLTFLSSVGGQHAQGTGAILPLHDAEVAFGKLPIDVTIVRAAYFLENWAGSLYGLPQGKLPTFVKADLTIPTVSATDIGRTIARAMLEHAKGHSVIELSGPRDLSPKDIAGIFSKLLAKTVVAEEGPESAMIQALTAAGLNAHWAQLFQELTHGVNTGLVAWEGGKARAVRGSTDPEATLRALAKV